ncbi:SDR family NAD(P)-dependent oxidoreductase [Paraburkholderia sp.]|uniref:SDR family NAD(P)-dependent oxidoreductase n=1 Tax=Paraburkholderia sp. TaxID=1926495 RepID=UPI003C757A9D
MSGTCTGGFPAAQTLSKRMLGRGGGRIVLVASIGVPQPKLTAAAYGASKAVVIQLSRWRRAVVSRDLAWRDNRHGRPSSRTVPGRPVGFGQIFLSMI